MCALCLPMKIFLDWSLMNGIVWLDVSSFTECNDIAVCKAWDCQCLAIYGSFCLQHFLAVTASLPTAAEPVESTLVAKPKPGIFTFCGSILLSKLTPHKMHEDSLTFENQKHCSRKMSIDCQTSVWFMEKLTDKASVRKVLNCYLETGICVCVPTLLIYDCDSFFLQHLLGPA